MNDHAFSTPEWLLDEGILRNIEHAGAIERIQNLQGRHLSNVMASSRMIRLIEDEAFRGDDAYTVIEMLEDLRNGIWSELSNDEPIDVYRRNLQRTYLNSVKTLMESDDSSVDGSDIKALLRGELRSLDRAIESSVSGAPDRVTQVHLEDVQERIESILDA